VTLELGVRVEEFAAHVRGVSVLGKRGSQVLDERGIALIGADGIWSTVADRLQPGTADIPAPQPGAPSSRSSRCQPNFVSPSFISGLVTTRIWSTTR
jgi:2-polyprenyl-6-methoxyphenol hydroxylase-like FAD-dependent oxidoreductase